MIFYPYCHLRFILRDLHPLLAQLVFQGPFSIKEMRQWNQYGYFMPELMMRASKMDAFQPLKEMSDQLNIQTLSRIVTTGTSKLM